MYPTVDFFSRWIILTLNMRLLGFSFTKDCLPPGITKCIERIPENSRLVCTYFNAFLIVIPNMMLEFNIVGGKVATFLNCFIADGNRFECVSTCVSVTGNLSQTI